MRQTYLALKLKFVTGCGYETYDTKEVEREHKEVSKDAAEGSHRRTKEGDTKEEENAPVLLVTHVNNILHWTFPMLRCTSTISKLTTPMDCRRTSLTFPRTSREPSPNTKEFCVAKSTTMENFPMILWRHPCQIHFPQSEWKCLVDPIASCCMWNWQLNISPPLNWYIQILELGTTNLSQTYFLKISDNPNVYFGSVDFPLYTRRVALSDDYHEERMDVLAYTPVKLNWIETLAKTFLIPALQNQFFQANIFNNAPAPRIALAMDRNSAFTESYTENPFWYQQFDLDKSEYSEAMSLS